MVGSSEVHRLPGPLRSHAPRDEKDDEQRADAERLEVVMRQRTSPPPFHGQPPRIWLHAELFICGRFSDFEAQCPQSGQHSVGAAAVLNPLRDDASAHKNANIWKISPNGTGLAALTNGTALGADSQAPRWSPDGASVVFHSSRKLDGTDAANSNLTRNIWRVNADGTNLRRVTSATAANADSLLPVWSPDVTKIVFDSSRKLDGTDAGSNIANVWRVNADGTNLVAITRTTVISNFDPRWSPDGTKVLFYSSRALDGTDTAPMPLVSNLWQVNADGTGLRPLTNSTAHGADNFSGQWSPDGSKIVFASSRRLDGTDAPNANGTTNIWRVNSDGTGLTPLTRATTTDAGSGSPLWSHDGTKIVFVSSRNPDGTDSQAPNFTFNIWLVNADGTELTPVTTTTSGADSAFPSFGP